MSVVLYTHTAMFEHNPGEGHPERPARLSAVLGALGDSDLDLERIEALPAGREALERVHPGAFVDKVFAAAPERGFAALDPDTFMSPGSLEATLRAAGAVVQAVEAAARGELTRAFCAVRPPGHHAEPTRAMGFCLFSSVAIAARAAQAAGLARVAVVDFDVHHGNGTQAAVEDDPSLFYASIHQSPLYPGTGAADETGVGNVVNAPAPPHAPRELWRRLFETRLIPRAADSPAGGVPAGPGADLGRFRRTPARPAGPPGPGSGGFRLGDPGGGRGGLRGEGPGCLIP
jgi:acetoin utilization deacetylase AcuC-like enzyme